MISFAVLLFGVQVQAGGSRMLHRVIEWQITATA
jgi:hypothetical protein